MSTASLPFPLRLPRASRRAAALATRPELPGLLLLAAVLNLWSLDLNGYANEYYAAAVRSMTESWHAFLFGAFDAAGVMTVDKPPLALWIQALSARSFGFSSWSLLVPQALMGVATVGLTYDLVRRRFGRAAGGVAGLVLALTPITVAISRHNNPDALLALCVVAALWFLVRALEDGRTRWLVLGGAMVGLGFEAKMAAALMVVPALAAAYLWAAPRGRIRALGQLGAGGTAMALVGLAWPVLVWLTPAASRPWVSGTDDNSIWSLILGYNGLGRLVGQQGGPGGAGGPGGGPGVGGGGVFGGEAGPLRLLNAALGGQAGWFLGFAVVAAVALAAVTRLRRSDARTGWLIAVGGSFATLAVAFSQASGIFHPYYVAELAPFTAALVGAGAGLLLRGGTVARVAGPVAIAGALLCQLAILDDTGGWLDRLPLALTAVATVAAVALAVDAAPRVRRAAVAAIVALLLLAPAAWAVQTLGHPTSSTFPAGGPQSAGGGVGGPGGGLRGPGGAFRGPGPGAFAGPPPGVGGVGAGRGGPFGGTAGVAEAVAYAAARGGGTVAVSSQSGAAGQLVAGGADLAAIGGFSGRESQVSVAWLADAVEDGRIRYVLTDGGSGRGMPSDGRVGASEVMTVAAAVGAAVERVDGLYDLRGQADALRAAAGA